MPARTRREPDTLVVVLERDGEPPETRRANDAKEALLFAVTMLIANSPLRVGDRLTVSPNE